MPVTEEEQEEEEEEKEEEAMTNSEGICRDFRQKYGQITGVVVAAGPSVTTFTVRYAGSELIRGFEALALEEAWNTVECHAGDDHSVMHRPQTDECLHGRSSHSMKN
ncbi:hypothetical protein E2C01_075726 [Portunus trituberculatus]|uniref:Uncharacterized protein n=1 Tax=Portunus trituberculatus TaxID=210409 RepID=A0A5B7IFS8_PORTR|nr:hypothetical protein [Portunus trituberculatus]